MDLHRVFADDATQEPPLILLALVITLSADAHAVNLRVSRIGALVQHTSCLARTVQCPINDYDKLWLTLGADKDDDAALEAWRAIDQILRRKRFGPDAMAMASAFLMPPTDMDGHARLRHEAFVAADLPALKTALAAWTPEADKAIAVLSRFEARFLVHWAKVGPKLDERRTSLAKWQPELSRFSADARRFLLSDWPVDKPFVVYLVDRPDAVRLAQAERIGDGAIVDVSGGDNLIDLARGICVQIVKAHYAAAPAKTHRDRQRALSAIESDALLAAYALLDDVLAYGLTLGEVQRRFGEMPKSRSNALVERLVAKVAPTLEAAFPTKPLDGAFAADVIRTIALAEGKELSTPKMALRFTEVAFDRPLTEARRELTRALSAEQVTGYSPLDAPDVVERMRMRTTSYMSVVWLVKPSDVQRLAAHKDLFDEKTLAAIAKLAAGGKPFCYGVRRPVPNPAYVFVATTTEEFKALFTAFAALQKPFVGAMPSASK